MTHVVLLISAIAYSSILHNMYSVLNVLCMLCICILNIQYTVYKRQNIICFMKILLNCNSTYQVCTLRITGYQITDQLRLALKNVQIILHSVCTLLQNWSLHVFNDTAICCLSNIQ